MAKLNELLKVKKTDGLFGVEIECEGERLGVVENDRWSSKADGSLRGMFPNSAIEWVFQKPMSLKDSILALNELVKAQKAVGAKPLFSFRTSTHVHINMQDATEDQLCAMIYAYCIVEELLVNFCGPVRKANRFCLSINDGEGILDYFTHLFRVGVAGMRVNENDVRYAALNIASLYKFGSLEVRTMRGTMDLDVLSTWLISLNSLREFAFEMGNPRAVHDFFARSSPQIFVEAVFPETWEQLIYPRWEEEMYRNFSITLDLAFAFVSAEQRIKKEEANPKIQVREWPAVAQVRIDDDFDERPARPRDEAGRFIPGVAWDHGRGQWIRWNLNEERNEAYDHIVGAWRVL
jgi:hypothetical protein